MTITLSFMCLLILLMFCFSSEYSLHGDKNEASSVVVVSNEKAMKHNDDAMKKLQVGGRSTSSGEEYSKEMTKMKKTITKKEKSVEEEKDDLVAYTADYWKPRHHPPKNN